MDKELFERFEDKLKGFNEGIDAKLKAFRSELDTASKEEFERLKADIRKDLQEINKERLEKLQSQVDSIDNRMQRAELQAEAKYTFESTIKDALKDFTQGGSARSLIRKAKGSGELELKAEDMTTANTLTNVLEPMRIPGFQFDPDRSARIRDLLPVGTTSASSVTYVYESAIADNTDITAEGQEYFQNDVDLALATATVRKITNYVICSDELLDDLPGFLSYISARLPSKLKVKEDTQLLSGSGTGINISGLTTNATAYSDNLADANVTRIDVLVDAARQVRGYEYEATAMVIHPADATIIKLTKDSTGNYIYPWIFMPNGQMVLDGVPVIVTTAMTSGQFLVGDFRRGAQVFDRKQMSLEISYENEDNFIKGMVTIRVSERLALAIYRSHAFIYGSFAAALAQGTA